MGSLRIEAGNAARLRHARMESLLGAEREDEMMDVRYHDMNDVCHHRKLDLARKASSMDPSVTDDEPSKKIMKNRASEEEKAKRAWYEHNKHMNRIQIIKEHLKYLADLPEEKVLSYAVLKGVEGPKFRSVDTYLGKPENLSSPWEANYQSCERYEEDLSLLLQDFEAKARHEFAVRGKWPKQAEVGALLLASKLRDKEWRKVKNNGTYMESLDNAWRAKIINFKEESIFQVIWEYVAGIAREWDLYRHPECYVPKNSALLKPIKSIKRKQQFIDVDMFTRIKRHDGVDLDEWPIRRPTNDMFMTYRA